MDDDKAKMDQCKTDIAINRTFRDEIPAIVEELAWTVFVSIPARTGV
jgi:hypothetical protein